MYANFRSPLLRMFHTKFNVDWPRCLQKKRCLKSVSDNSDDDDDVRQSMASMAILESLYEPRLSELKSERIDLLNSL